MAEWTVTTKSIAAHTAQHNDNTITSIAVSDETQSTFNAHSSTAFNSHAIVIDYQTAQQQQMERSEIESPLKVLTQLKEHLQLIEDTREPQVILAKLQLIAQ